ncbi:MAG: methyltransferase domain-containing protein [Proteobacteria bacterium]|nr:MAG: methyltransferase domain-containing protein [Pseudomonadota bacterium]
MTDKPLPADSTAAQLIEHLACPTCRGALTRTADGVYCEPCRHEYPFVDGIAVMTRLPGLAPDSEDGEAGDVMLENQLRRDRQDLESGRRIRRQRRELHIVTAFLSELPASETLLDLGCRGGRFSGPMQSAARLLIEADRHIPVVRHAIGNAMNPARVAGLVCEPERLPFANGTLDGVVCVRLSHRIDGAGRRERLLHELLRVSSTFTLFSFSETNSLPNASRRIRRRPIHDGTMRVDRIAEIAESHGARIVHSATVSPFGSRHCFVSLEKTR